MNLYTFVTLVLLIMVIGIVVEKILNSRRQSDQEDPQAEAVEEKDDSAISKVVERMKGIAQEKQRAGLSELLRTWATENLNDNKELKVWLTSLSDEGLQALAVQIADFCAELNLELSWLINPQLELNPKLKQITQDTVISYCSICWQAVQVQDEVAIFRTFLSVTESPMTKTNREVSSVLLTELQKQNLASAIPPELVLGQEKQRQTYITQSIQEATHANPQQVYHILQEMNGLNGEVPIPDPG